MKNFVILLLAILAVSCNGINPLNNAALRSSPYEMYLKSLEQAELDKTDMARQWVGAGQDALRDSVMLKLPFSESGYFLASQPAARSYRFDARRGQVLTINGRRMSEKNSRLFLDFFLWEENEWKPVAHSDSTFSLTYEFDDEAECLVRLQPELLVTTDYSIAISLTPVLINPVTGATNKSIKSFYGDSRDGGKRRHEGVDIFAKKGTPVVAPTSGVVTRVGTGRLGGNVVWLRDQKRGHSYYFAHLDQQLVSVGKVLSKGDTLGTVGNTGNARYTPPHLHFGIYQHGSFDPVHFIQTLEAGIEPTPWDTTLTDFDYKVSAKKVAMKAGPGEHYDSVTELLKETYVQVIAQSDNWYRVQLPDNRKGFVLKTNASPIQKGKELQIVKPSTIFSEVGDDAVPLQRLEDGTVELLASFEDFMFVRTKHGIIGWLLI